MKLVCYILFLSYIFSLSYITIDNYLFLKKLKKNSLKNNKIIDYDFWGDFYE